MKKANMTILASIFVMALVAGSVGLGTSAWLSDTETSENNIFTAGTLDLQINVGGSKWYGKDVSVIAPAAFTVSDVIPGDSDSAVVGLYVDRDAWAKIYQIPTSNAENDLNDREVEAGDTLTGDWNVGEWGGELDEYLYVSMWIDTNENGKHDSGEKYLYGDYDTSSGKYVKAKDLRIADVFPDLAEYYPPSFDPIEFCIVPEHLVGGQVTWIGISWRVDGEKAGNEIQSDSISFDVIFEVKQYEHNEDGRFKFQGES